MNKRIQLTAALLSMAAVSYGQYAGDAFRYSDQAINGTARFQGLGGNHAALGGDASNAFGNPAGLGFYNRSELSISPSLRLLNVDGTYLGQTSTANRSQASIGQASLIFAGGNRNGENNRIRRTTFGITYSQQTNFANEFVLRGTNNRSSLLDNYVASVNGLNVGSGTLDQDYTPSSGNQPGVAGSLEAAAYQLFLVNPTQENGTNYFRYDRGVPVNQQTSFRQTGAQSQWGLSYAGNLDDKFYIGGTLAFSRTRYEYTQNYSESFNGGRYYRGFGELSDYSVTGNGVNLTIGAIYKPDQNVQIGVTIATPTFTSLKETFNQSLSVDPVGSFPSVDQQGNPINITPNDNVVDVAPNDFDFRMTSPLRASGGLTYLFGRNGFLTGTVEYVGYSGMRVNTSYSQNAADNQAFREDYKNEIQLTYKNVVNLRVGGEFRAGLFRARAGVAYLPSAYKENLDGLTAADRQRILLSAGIGVRNNRFFADIAGVTTTFKSAFTPYTLNDPTAYGSGLLSNRNTNLTLSLGVFF